MTGAGDEGAAGEHPSVTTLRGLAGAVSAGDLDAFVDAYAEDALFRVGGDNLVSGDYRGRQSIRCFLMTLFEMTDGTLHLEVDDVIGTDNHGMMFWHLTGRRKDRTLDARGAMAFKLDDEHRITESWFLHDDQAGYDRFWG